MKTKRQFARDCAYELYDKPGCKDAARKIDGAVGRAAKKVLQKTRKGMSLQQAMNEALVEYVRPVMAQLSEFGAGDTEPEWMVANVLKELVEQQIGTTVNAGWDLRFSM
jgi:hypothetical protein